MRVEMAISRENRHCGPCVHTGRKETNVGNERKKKKCDDSHPSDSDPRVFETHKSELRVKTIIFFPRRR